MEIGRCYPFSVLPDQEEAEEEINGKSVIHMSTPKLDNSRFKALSGAIPLVRRSGRILPPIK